MFYIKIMGTDQAMDCSPCGRAKAADKRLWDSKLFQWALFFYIFSGPLLVK